VAQKHDIVLAPSAPLTWLRPKVGRMQPPQASFLFYRSLG
jgi:hypothetical protein